MYSTLESTNANTDLYAYLVPVSKILPEHEHISDASVCTCVGAIRCVPESVCGDPIELLAVV